MPVKKAQVERKYCGMIGGMIMWLYWGLDLGFSPCKMEIEEPWRNSKFGDPENMDLKLGPQ